MCLVASPAVPGERQALPAGMQQHRAALCSSAQGGWWGLQRRQLAFCSSVDFSTHLGLNGEIYIILQCLAWSLELLCKTRRTRACAYFKKSYQWRWYLNGMSLPLFGGGRTGFKAFFCLRRCISHNWSFFNHQLFWVDLFLNFFILLKTIKDLLPQRHG